MAEHPLHRSFLRAAVLGPLVALPAAGAEAALCGSREGFVLLAIGFVTWAGLLVVAGDLAGQGTRLRRALVVLLAPTLLPFLVLVAALQVGQTRLDRAGAWAVPARALELLTGEHRESGVALLLASLVPFTAMLTTRARGRPRPLAAHAAVAWVSSYAGVLVLEHLCDVALPLESGRHVLLACCGGMALLLVFLEARPGLHGLAGPAAPRSRGIWRDGGITLAGLGALLVGSLWLHPIHFAGRLERRAQSGEVAALAHLVALAPDPFARFLAAIESRWPGERAAAFDLTSELRPQPIRSFVAVDGAVAAARRDPSPAVRLAAVRYLALTGWGWRSAPEVAALRACAKDDAAAIRFWARLGLLFRGVEGFPTEEAARLLPALPGEEREALARTILARLASRIDDHRRWSRWGSYRSPPPAPLADDGRAQLAFLALATSGSPSARRDIDEALDAWEGDLDLGPPCPALREALQRLLRGANRAQISPELSALAGLDGPP